MSLLQQGLHPVFANGLALKEALRGLWNHQPAWPPKSALLPFARQSLGIAPEFEDRWYRAAWWGYYASHLLSWHRREKGGDEILDLLEPADWTVLDHALAAGRGVILATAHLGPGLIPGMAVRAAGYPTLEIGAEPGGGKRAQVIPAYSEADRKQSLAKALLHLRRNNIVVAAPDGRFGSKHFVARFLNQDITIYTGIGELARLSGAVTCWLSASWIGPDRIRIHVRGLDSPCGEGDEWLRQWYLAYLNRLARQMRRSPADLGFRFGLWRTAAGGLHWYQP